MLEAYDDIKVGLDETEGSVLVQGRYHQDVKCTNDYFQDVLGNQHLLMGHLK